ncbi:MAG: hypothetical protein GY865_18960 [candidate division Zixibacteria bacterium]|nr:hypothetical protein [candidate division Zixibacteria bacterium]
MKKTILVFGILLITFASFIIIEANDKKVGEPTVESVLARYIKAVGGRIALENLVSRDCVGKKITDLTSRQYPIYVSSHMEAFAQVPTKYKLEIWIDDGGHKEGFDGKTGWLKDKCGIQTDKKLIKNKLAFFLNPQGPLYIEEYFPQLTYAGINEINNMSVHALEPASLQMEYYTLYFSVESGLLVAIGYHSSVEDYRNIDGVMVPYKFVMGRKGGSVVYQFDNITHNITKDKSIFAVPE